MCDLSVSVLFDLIQTEVFRSVALTFQFLFHAHFRRSQKHLIGLLQKNPFMYMSIFKSFANDETASAEKIRRILKETMISLTDRSKKALFGGKGQTKLCQMVSEMTFLNSS